MADVLRTTLEGLPRDRRIMDAMGIRLRNKFSMFKAYRRSKELEWLECLRQYKGIYDPEVVIDTYNSKVYPKLTRSKVNIVLSRLHEMLFPDTKKNWELTTSPEPRVSKEIVNGIVRSMIQQADPQSGQPNLPTADELYDAIQDYVAEACERMSIVIDDQLFEMDYPEETKKVLRSGLMYGTGIMKGPLVGKRRKRMWYPTDAGDYEEKISEEDIPDLHFVRLWDWFPDMTVTEYEKGDGSFERHVMTKHDLRILARTRSDFEGDIILDYLATHPDGDYVPLNFEVDLQTIDIEATKGGTNRSTAVSGSSDTGTKPTGKKYEVIEFWGYQDGADLAACGKHIYDTKSEYMVNIWLLGNRIIKVAVFDKEMFQYKLFYYEKDETSIYGEGLARIMRHSQLAVAAGARMVLDNGACVAGPQVEVNWSLMTKGTDLNSFYSRKIWFREGKGIDAQYPALRVYNIDSHIDELLKIIDAFKGFADEETTLPTWLIGQTMKQETAQATSGRMSMITMSIKDVVRNFDAYTERNIQDLYSWNMEFNPRKDIKGDFVGRALGVSSLVMKEIRMQALANLTSTMTDKEWEYIPTRDFLKEKLDAFDLKISLLSEEEVTANRQAEAEAQDKSLEAEMTKAEIAYKKAQTLSQLSKARSTNVDAITQSIEAEGGGGMGEGEAALQDLELVGKSAEIRRAEEAHAADLSHKDEAHQAAMVTSAFNIAKQNAGGQNG